jgi:hypothetical protein
MTRRLTGIAAAALGFLCGAAVLADVVVLKGGTVIPLKQPVVRRGNTAYITRADGTLLSVPTSEIDRDATAAANRTKEAPAAPAAPPASNPADAARAKDGQKAKVRITDADVSHPLEFPEPGDDKDKDKDKKEQGSGIARVEVGDYSREPNGATVVIKGSLRNPGQGPAENVRLSVSAFDEKGQSIDGTNATLSKGTLDPGGTIEFTATLTVGEKTIGSLKFQPQWTTPKPPPAAGAPGQAGAAGGAAQQAPKPVPTPYGRGTLYAAPQANASTDRPADSNTGYLPGVSSPDNQPKPPTP